jgi:hypothetical protein
MKRKYGVMQCTQPNHSDGPYIQTLIWNSRTRKVLYMELTETGKQQNPGLVDYDTVLNIWIKRETYMRFRYYDRLPDNLLIECL